MNMVIFLLSIKAFLRFIIIAISWFAD